MSRRIVGWVIAITLCLSATLALGQQREKEPKKKPGNEPQGQSSAQHKPEGTEKNQPPSTSPGGDWSQRTHSGKQSSTQSTGAQGAAAADAMHKNQTPQASGAEGAAAGAAATNRNQPQYSGAQGAAAGAATANRNQPQYSGAQGAAAGAAVANRNQPQYSGAEGAAAGAAAVNRNQPQYSAAQGAAVGAAVANNNQSQNGAAQGAVVGAAVANNNQQQNSAAPGAVVANNNQPQNSAPAGMPASAPGANTSQPQASDAARGAAGYEAVRNSFNASNVYRPQWWKDHPETWVPAGWIPGAAWHPTPWGGIAEFCGYGNVAPISYDYGVTVTAQNGNVLVNGQNVGTTGEFSSQAAQIAQSGAAAEASPTEQWQPLGVYAMVRNEQQHPQLIVQLAINKQGILRGNYIDELTESTLPIRGAVDKATKRAAWTVGSNQQTVMEAGLSDLTDPETPALIHKNGKTDHWILVHLDQPK